MERVVRGHAVRLRIIRADDYDSHQLRDGRMERRRATGQRGVSILEGIAKSGGSREADVVLLFFLRSAPDLSPIATSCVYLP